MTVASLWKRLVGTEGPRPFAPDAYWERRHSAYRDSHEAVGHIGLSAEANAAQYATKRDLILAAIGRTTQADHGKTLLDAGCGIGLLTRTFVEVGYSVVGADFCASAIARAKSHSGAGAFIVSPLSTLALRRHFDVVVVADVLLHVVDDVEWRQTLAALTKHLAPNGVLVILDWFEENTDALGEHVRPRAVGRYRRALFDLECEVLEHTRFTLPHERGTKDLLVAGRRAGIAE